MFVIANQFRTELADQAGRTLSVPSTEGARRCSVTTKLTERVVSQILAVDKKADVVKMVGDLNDYPVQPGTIGSEDRDIGLDPV